MAFLALVVAGPGIGEAALPVVDDCQETDYLDRTAPNDDRVFDWDYAFAGSPERCLKIRVGQTVHWVGNFGDHPLDPDQGDSPNPIATRDGSGFVSFDRVGLFGYRCNYHLAMRGAIQVVAGTAAPPAAVPWGTRWGTALVVLTLMVIGLWTRSPGGSRRRDCFNGVA